MNLERLDSFKQTFSRIVSEKSALHAGRDAYLDKFREHIRNLDFEAQSEFRASFDFINAELKSLGLEIYMNHSAHVNDHTPWGKPSSLAFRLTDLPTNNDVLALKAERHLSHEDRFHALLEFLEQCSPFIAKKKLVTNLETQLKEQPIILRVKI